MKYYPPRRWSINNIEPGIAALFAIAVVACGLVGGVAWESRARDRQQARIEHEAATECRALMRYARSAGDSLAVAINRPSQSRNGNSCARYLATEQTTPTEDGK